MNGGRQGIANHSRDRGLATSEKLIRHCFNLVDIGGGVSWAASLPAGFRAWFRPCREPSRARSWGAGFGLHPPHQTSPGLEAAEPAFEVVGGGGHGRVVLAAHEVEPPFDEVEEQVAHRPFQAHAALDHSLPQVPLPSFVPAPAATTSNVKLHRHGEGLDVNPGLTAEQELERMARHLGRDMHAQAPECPAGQVPGWRPVFCTSWKAPSIRSRSRLSHRWTSAGRSVRWLRRAGVRISRPRVSR